MNRCIDAGVAQRDRFVELVHAQPRGVRRDGARGLDEPVAVAVRLHDRREARGRGDARERRRVVRQRGEVDGDLGDQRARLAVESTMRETISATGSP